MKKILTITILFCAVQVRAQQTTSSSVITVKDKQYPAILMSFKADDRDVEEVIRKEIEEGKGSWNTKRGLIIGKKSSLGIFSSQDLNSFWKVDSKGKKSREEVSVYMSLQRPDSVFVTDPADAGDYAAAAAYLSTLPMKVEMYRKNEELNALKKQLAGLTKDLNNMRKRRDDQEKNFDKKSKDLERLTKKIEDLEKGNL